MEYYTKHTFDHFARGIGKKNKDPLLTLKETWQQFYTAVALVVIKEVMDDKNQMLLIKLGGSFAVML